jgi:FHS family Na+ dependent glucose MFS transporter 1
LFISSLIRVKNGLKFQSTWNCQGSANLYKRLSQFFKNEAIVRTFHYYFLFIYLGLATGITGPTLPALSTQTNVSLGQMGYIFLLSSIGYGLGTVLGGRLLDRYKGHTILGLGQLMSAVLIMLVPVVPWFWLLMLIVMLKGISDGQLNGVNTLLVWTHAAKAGPFMNALHFFFGLGAFIAPFLVARLIINPFGYYWAYWGVGLFGVLVGMRMLFLPGSPKPIHTHTDENGTRSPVYYPLVLMAALYLFFYVGAEITYAGWIFSYATKLEIFNAQGAAYLTSAFWLFFTIGRLISIPLATRFRPGQIIPAALLGCVLTLVLVVVMPVSSGLLWGVTIVLGFFMAPLWPTGFTLAGQSIKLTARISSIILLGDSFGGMVLPWVVGQVIDLTGPQSMVLLVFGSVLLNLLAFVLMVRMARGRTQPG